MRTTEIVLISILKFHERLLLYANDVLFDVLMQLIILKKFKLTIFCTISVCNSDRKIYLNTVSEK